MRKLANFLLGSVRILVTGPFPERFLNLCGEENLGFWDVEREGAGQLRVTIGTIFLKRARILANKGGCQLKCELFMGFPAFFARFRKRYALLAGLGLAVAAACFLSQFILVVNVSGNQTVSDFVVLTELDRLGFGVGSYGPAVDERALANQALLDLEELGYLNINIRGIYAEVEVRERTPVPEIEDRTSPADVVAATDGVVLDVNLLAGQTVVGEGQAVLAGEVLISGTNTYESGDGSGAILSTRQEHAAGEVWAMTRRKLSACTPLEVTTKTATGGEKTRYSLRILKHDIKFWQNSSIFDGMCDTIKTTSALTLPGGVELPIALTKSVFAQYAPGSGQLERQQAERFLKAQLEQRLAGLIGDRATVLSKGWSSEASGGVLTVTLEASCTEDIARTLLLE